MVEDVEKFHTNIESQILFNHGVFQQPEIRVVESRTVEKATIGGSKRSRNAVLRESTHTRLAGRRCRVTRDLRCRKVQGWRDEVAPSVVVSGAIRIRISGIQNLKRAYAIRHVGGRAAPQSEITVALVQLYRKTGGESRDALDLPALRQTLGPMRKKPVERERPDVAGNEILSDVARGKSAAQLGIYEIHQVAEGRRVIQGFAEGVGNEE